MKERCSLKREAIKCKIGMRTVRESRKERPPLEEGASCRIRLFPNQEKGQHRREQCVRSSSDQSSFAEPPKDLCIPPNLWFSSSKSSFPGAFPSSSP
jgi:hypothetical protein